MKTTILSFIFILLIGCGESSSTPIEATVTLEQAVPKSPVLSEKEKIPPSIPDI